MALSITAQARELRRLTGVSIRRAVAAITTVTEKPRRPAPKHRQMTFEEMPASETEVREAFAKLRRELGAKQS